MPEVAAAIGATFFDQGDAFADGGRVSKHHDAGAGAVVELDQCGHEANRALGFPALRLTLTNLDNGSSNRLEGGRWRAAVPRQQHQCDQHEDADQYDPGQTVAFGEAIRVQHD